MWEPNKVGCELQIFQDCSTWAGARLTKVLPLPCPWGLLFAGTSDRSIALPRDVGVVSPGVCQAVTLRMSTGHSPTTTPECWVRSERNWLVASCPPCLWMAKASGGKRGVFI